MKPYVYLIGWSQRDFWYIGAQYGPKADPLNLWTSYFTSSRIVKRRRSEWGEPDSFRIIKTFADPLKCIAYEKRVLSFLNAHSHPKLLNQQSCKGFLHTAEIKAKISAKAQGRFKGWTYEQIMGEDRAKLLRAQRSVHFSGVDHKGTKNPMFGKKRPQWLKDKLSKERTGSGHPTFGWKWITNGVDNKKVPPSTQLMNGWYFGRAMSWSKCQI